MTQDTETDAGAQLAERPGAAPQESFPVVGVGASAGGLDAFSRFLQHVPVDTGCAFVLVQHLDPSHPSRLNEILSRVTAMPVREAVDGLPVARDCVYVIPPNTALTIVDRVLRLAPRAATGTHLPIDRFLQSLAEDCGERAIGVILSGAGSDGAAGLLAVKDANGVTFAQEPASAEFPSMPSMAASAGGADIVGLPEEIARELARIARLPPFAGPAAPARNPGNGAPAAGEQLRAVCDIMHEATGIDFGLYRELTVQRRVQRRMALRGAASFGDYARLLAGDADERVALKHDLLICVTSFFRDPESFEALKQLVFPVIVRNRPAAAPIRIWVPGCATGEEPYSILMALHEYQKECGSAFPVQLFASDISDLAIQRARAGRYPDSIANDVGPERLRQHFSRVDGVFQVSKALRESCIFSRHNLLDDPPFSRLDLISCRNVLIYLRGAQRAIIPLFHYALDEHGFLMLGRAETPHDHGELFSVVDSRHRIYAKRPVAKKPYASFARGRAPAHRAPGLSPSSDTPAARSAADVSRDADRILLSRFSPTGLVVDERLEVLEIRGQPAPFLALTPGKASLHLLKLLPDTGLFLEVERLTREAARSGEAARAEHVPYEVDGRSGLLNVEVAPLGNEARRAYLVLFEPIARAASGELDRGAGPPDSAAVRDAQITKLNQELSQMRARLVSLVDDHDASDEENQQITEDALSANEELQSLTEELETAKEELQSTNEELLTVNRELESRNVALASAGQLARATVDTVGVPLMVVDDELVVRYVNAAFARTFQLSVAAAEGQPLHTLSDGVWNISELRARLEGLRVEGKAFERVEVESPFPSLGTRVLLLSGCRMVDLGLILLTIEDVTRQREAERALQRSEEQRRQSERMETVGRLAGGIAHDFNNLLTVIIGDAELLRDLQEDDEAVELLDEICHAGEKAAALTDQLLSFSRRKILQPKAFDLNLLVRDFEKMLRRLLGELIKTVIRTGPDKCMIKADSGEIGRVLMNLCLNARDAMPAGGVLTIETRHVDLDEANAARAGAAPGRYVQLVVEDTGLGMDAETRRHVFEPFFTTKEASKGAGLGLATVFGIVHHGGGAVTCESEVGQGTRFTLLLPSVAAEAGGVEVDRRGLTAAPRGSSEVVLLVEDQDEVRRLMRKVLERSGYVVLEASDGRAGLAIVESHPDKIDLLVSDVVMPAMSGGRLAERAVALRPDLKVLFVSGHTEDILVKEGVTQGMHFLQKPYTPAELAIKVSEVLGPSKRQLH